VEDLRVRAPAVVASSVVVVAVVAVEDSRVRSAVAVSSAVAVVVVVGSVMRASAVEVSAVAVADVEQLLLLSKRLQLSTVPASVIVPHCTAFLLS
jgi:hypothetical protein